jgi:hypothetical protein
MPPSARWFSARTLRTLASAALPAAALAGGLLFSACDESDWPDRKPQPVEGVAVDSLLFLPNGSRYVPAESSVQVLFSGYLRGYSCAKVLKMALEPSVDFSSWLPSVTVLPPAAANCPLDSGLRDSVITAKFPEGPVTLRNSKGDSTAGAIALRGRLTSDSIFYDTAGAIPLVQKGRYTYHHEVTGLPPTLSGDSLSACELLNQAEAAADSGGVLVRFSLLVLDSCGSGTASDSVPVRPARRPR